MPEKQFIAFESNNNSKKYEKSEIIGSIQRSLMDLNRSRKKNYKVLLKDIKESIQNLEIFLPFRELQKGGYFLKEKEFYLPGYGFIEYDPNVTYLGLDENIHVNQIVLNEDSEELDLVSGEVIESEQMKMDEFFKGQFKSGQLVQIIGGTYADLPARVVELDDSDGKYKVVVCFRSDIRYLKVDSDKLRIFEFDRIIIEEDF